MMVVCDSTFYPQKKNNILTLIRIDSSFSDCCGFQIAPFGDDWREYCSYPQVPFPSVIPPAVIESWPPSGTGGYLRNLSAL